MSSKIIDLYIDRVLSFAELPADRAREVREELADHLAQAAAANERRGLGPEDAVWEAIRRHGHPRVVGQRIRRPWQWIDIRRQGTARGFIAVGPRAVGVIACGGMAAGVVAMGGAAAGLVSLGGLSIGLLLALGGCALGGVALGGAAIGLMAVGGFATGLVAEGAMMIALWAPHVRGSAEAHTFYQAANVPEWLRQMGSYLGTLRALMIWFVNLSYLALILPIVAIWRQLTRRDEPRDDSWLFE